MKLEPMKFKGVQWSHNPRELCFENAKAVTDKASPLGGSTQIAGRKGMKIKGKGELYGQDCLEQFQKLLRLFRSGGGGVLAIARLTPVFAVFEELKVIGKPSPDVLEYEFVFRELMDKGTEKPVEYSAVGGETLWDVSYRFGIAIETLLALNKNIKRPDIDLNGGMIKLC